MEKVKNFEGLNLLEVGSGRGGGIDYLSKYFKFETAVGIDFSGN